ncbi:MAG: hypothetical protein ACOX6H_00725 [Christensenellales bacterium]|jgi:hypothetical protein
MIGILALIVAITFVIVVDLIPMIKIKYTKGIVAFIVVLIPAVIYGVLLSLGVEVQDVAVLLWRFMKSIGISY